MRLRYWGSWTRLAMPYGSVGFPDSTVATNRPSGLDSDLTTRQISNTSTYILPTLRRCGWPGWRRTPPTRLQSCRWMKKVTAPIRWTSSRQEPSVRWWWQPGYVISDSRRSWTRYLAQMWLITLFLAKKAKSHVTKLLLLHQECTTSGSPKLFGRKYRNTQHDK